MKYVSGGKIGSIEAQFKRSFAKYAVTWHCSYKDLGDELALKYFREVDYERGLLSWFEKEIDVKDFLIEREPFN